MSKVGWNQCLEITKSKQSKKSNLIYKLEGIGGKKSKFWDTKVKIQDKVKMCDDDEV